MDQFDNELKKVRGAMIAVWAGFAIVSLSALVFVGWVVVKVMQHFGIL